jgi:hypothetical protein
MESSLSLIKILLIKTIRNQIICQQIVYIELVGRISAMGIRFGTRRANLAGMSHGNNGILV